MKLEQPREALSAVSGDLCTLIAQTQSPDTQLYYRLGQYWGAALRDHVPHHCPCTPSSAGMRAHEYRLLRCINLRKDRLGSPVCRMPMPLYSPGLSPFVGFKRQVQSTSCSGNQAPVMEGTTAFCYRAPLSYTGLPPPPKEKKRGGGVRVKALIRVSRGT